MGGVRWGVKIRKPAAAAQNPVIHQNRFFNFSILLLFWRHELFVSELDATKELMSPSR